MPVPGMLYPRFGLGFGQVTGLRIVYHRYHPSTLDITVLGLVDIYMSDDTTIDLSVRRVPEPGPGGQHLLQ